MNDKLKSILHTAWNEPRHFFFWLAMLCICGFIAAAGAAALITPTLFLAFVALGCILCFVVCIPAFVLAWIPPVRRLFSWLLRRRFLVLGCLVTLITLFYAVENWRGRHAWQSYKRAGETKGEQFEWASLAQPPVPEDQNFFETPLWTDLRVVATNRSTAPSNSDSENDTIFNVYRPRNDDAPPGLGSWIKTQRVDLAAWQAYYRRSSDNVPSTDSASLEAFRRRYLLGALKQLLQVARLRTTFPSPKNRRRRRRMFCWP